MQDKAVRQERRYCARLGWALVLTIVCAWAWQGLLLALLPTAVARRLGQTAYDLLLVVGHYAVALPLAFWLCRSIPVPPRTRRGLRFRLLGRWWTIGAALMWSGAWLGTVLSELVGWLADLPPDDRLTQVLTQMPLPAVLLGACLFGPVCEELLFRGLLAGRLARYGQKPAAWVSALLFGLYHANVEQFFYAFALGLLLAYAYFYTGTLAAPVLLHILFNLYGSFLVLLLPAGSVWALAYALSWPVLTVVGLGLLVRGWPTQQWAHGPCPPAMGVVFGNPGIVMAALVCLAEAALMLVI